jgi:hypothetical protein
MHHGVAPVVHVADPNPPKEQVRVPAPLASIDDTPIALALPLSLGDPAGSQCLKPCPRVPVKPLEPDEHDALSFLLF